MSVELTNDRAAQIGETKETERKGIKREKEQGESGRE